MTKDYEDIMVNVDYRFGKILKEVAVLWDKVGNIVRQGQAEQLAAIAEDLGSRIHFEDFDIIQMLIHDLGEAE